MSPKFDVTATADYVLATYAGEYSAENGRTVVDRIAELCPASNTHPVLIDCREMTGRITVLDRFSMAVYGQCLVGRVPKIAMVGPPALVESDLIFEVAANNRGLNLKVFTDVGEAGEWLKK